MRSARRVRNNGRLFCMPSSRRVSGRRQRRARRLPEQRSRGGRRRRGRRRSGGRRQRRWRRCRRQRQRRPPRLRRRTRSPRCGPAPLPPPDSFSPLRPGAAAAAACGDVARTLRHCRRRATLFRRLCRPRRKRAGTRADGRGAREGALYWAFPNIGKTHSMVGLSLTFLYFFFLRVCPSRMRLACVWRGRLVRPALPARDSRVVLLILAGLDGPQPRRQHGVTEASHALRSHGRAPTPALCSPLHQFR